MGIWDDQVSSETFPAALAQDGPLAKAMQWLTGPNGGLANSMGMRPWYEQSPMDIAMGFAPSVGMGAIRAFHGSPHNFDKFDMSKIGTGEGAASYGHGLYFAGNEGVAKVYRDQVKNMPLIDSVNARLSEIARERDKIRESGALFDKASPDRQRFTDLASEYDRLMAEKMKPGKMYEVDINANPAHLLDWDKPLSQQSEKVREAMARLGVPGETSKVYKHIGDSLSAGRSISSQGAEIQASQTLREAGIPGIRYLDQGSRNAGEGTSNYVMFDDKLIDIIRKYGLAGLAVPGALAPYAASQGDY